MYEKIVWGTDGSVEADRALPAVIDLATQTHATVTVVHVDEHFYGGRSSGESVFADEPELRTKIEEQVEELHKHDIPAAFHLVRMTSGEPADAIAEVAENVHADLIVVATRGHGRLTGLVLGSVAQRLLHVAPCAVLVIPPAVREPATV